MKKFIELIKNITGINKYCQSCAMPLKSGNSYGTEQNGTSSKDYCHNCYQNGQFTRDCTMEEMIELCIPHVKQVDPSMTEQKIRTFMTKCLSYSKRWR